MENHKMRSIRSEKEFRSNDGKKCIRPVVEEIAFLQALSPEVEVEGRNCDRGLSLFCSSCVRTGIDFWVAGDVTCGESKTKMSRPRKSIFNRGKSVNQNSGVESKKTTWKTRMKSS